MAVRKVHGGSLGGLWDAKMDAREPSKGRFSFSGAGAGRNIIKTQSAYVKELIGTMDLDLKFMTQRIPVYKIFEIKWTLGSRVKVVFRFRGPRPAGTSSKHSPDIIRSLQVSWTWT